MNGEEDIEVIQEEEDEEASQGVDEDGNPINKDEKESISTSSDERDDAKDQGAKSLSTVQQLTTS